MSHWFQPTSNVVSTHAHPFCPIAPVQLTTSAMRQNECRAGSSPLITWFQHMLIHVAPLRLCSSLQAPWDMVECTGAVGQNGCARGTTLHIVMLHIVILKPFPNFKSCILQSWNTPYWSLQSGWTFYLPLTMGAGFWSQLIEFNEIQMISNTLRNQQNCAWTPPQTSKMRSNYLPEAIEVIKKLEIWNIMKTVVFAMLSQG